MSYPDINDPATSVPPPVPVRASSESQLHRAGPPGSYAGNIDPSLRDFLPTSASDIPYPTVSSTFNPQQQMMNAMSHTQNGAPIRHGTTSTAAATGAPHLNTGDRWSKPIAPARKRTLLDMTEDEKQLEREEVSFKRQAKPAERTVRQAREQKSGWSINTPETLGAEHGGGGARLEPPVQPEVAALLDFSDDTTQLSTTSLDGPPILPLSLRADVIANSCPAVKFSAQQGDNKQTADAAATYFVAPPLSNPYQAASDRSAPHEWSSQTRPPFTLPPDNDDLQADPRYAPSFASPYQGVGQSNSRPFSQSSSAAVRAPGTPNSSELFQSASSSSYQIDRFSSQPRNEDIVDDPFAGFAQSSNSNNSSDGMQGVSSEQPFLGPAVDDCDFSLVDMMKMIEEGTVDEWLQQEFEEANRGPDPFSNEA